MFSRKNILKFFALLLLSTSSNMIFANGSPILIEQCLRNDIMLREALNDLEWEKPNGIDKIDYEEKMAKCIINKAFDELNKTGVEVKTTQSFEIDKAVNKAKDSTNKYKVLSTTAATITEPPSPEGGSIADQAAYALYLSANQKAKEELNAYLMSLFISKLCPKSSTSVSNMKLRYTCKALKAENALNPNTHLLKSSIKKDITGYPFHVQVFDCSKSYIPTPKFPGCAPDPDGNDISNDIAMKIVYKNSYIPYFISMINILENISNTTQIKLKFDKVDLIFMEEIAQFGTYINDRRTLSQQLLISSFITAFIDKVQLLSKWNNIVQDIKDNCRISPDTNSLQDCISRYVPDREQYPDLKNITALPSPILKEIDIEGLKSLQKKLEDLNNIATIYNHFLNQQYQEALNYGIRKYSVGGNLQNYTNSMFWAVDLAQSKDYKEMQTKLSDLFSDHGTYIYLGRKHQKTGGLFAGLGYSHLKFNNNSENHFSTKVGFRYSFGLGQRYWGPRLTIFDFTGSFSGDSAPENLDGFFKASYSPSIDVEIQPFADTPFNIVFGLGTRRKYFSDTKTSGPTEKFLRIGIEFTTNLISF